jgi:arsenate reductase (thioredoxin)
MNASAPVHVLFLCNHNIGRSILAEAILNHLGHGRFVAHSGGRLPEADGQVHPLTLEALQSAGLSTTGLRSKGWDEFATANAPHMDLVITLCDDAAREPCPIWPGHPALAHWGYPDPTLVEGSHEHRLEAFKQTMLRLHQRLELFIHLPQDRLDRLILQNHALELTQRS